MSSNFMTAVPSAVILEPKKIYFGLNYLTPYCETFILICGVLGFPGGSDDKGSACS